MNFKKGDLLFYLLGDDGWLPDATHGAGIFTYKTGWFLGHMLVNIPYMEQIDIISIPVVFADFHFIHQESMNPVVLQLQKYNKIKIWNVVYSADGLRRWSKEIHGNSTSHKAWTVMSTSLDNLPSGNQPWQCWIFPPKTSIV